MERQRKRSFILLIIALAMMVGGSRLGSWINTGAGAATVTEQKLLVPPGYVVSAYLYTPKEATVQKPAPAVMVIHGLNNQKNYMANTALEFARRGYVVLSMDMTGHGFSSGANSEGGSGAAGALNYLRSLANVDKNNVGLVGMSQGGFAAATSAALALPDGYTSIFYMESEPTPPGVMNVEPFLGLKNVAVNIGTVTELGVMIFVSKGTDAPVSPVLQPLFGTKEPIKVGQVYGSIANGTARILYQPWEDHAGSTDSGAAIGNAIDWMQRTLGGGTGLPPKNQIWGWKLFGTTLALLGAMLFLFPMGALLLQTSYFKPLAEATPEYRGFTGAGWWIGALITTAVGPLIYLWVWSNMFFAPWVTANSLWPQTFTNTYMVWGVITGAISIFFILVNHFVFMKKRGATAVNYGLTSEGRGVEWNKVWKSLILAALTLLPVYCVLVLVNAVWKVDFRAWVVALMPMSPPRFSAFLGYLVPFAICFVPQSILLAGFLRVGNGKASIGREMAVNAVMLTLGVVAWLLLLYVPIIAGGKQILASGPIGETIAGLGGIYYIPLVILWPLVACLYTFFFRKTGRVYVGASLVTFFIVWYLAAFGVFAFAP
jgi:pimeloyl-ACP methyl ester carboxylesterase